MDKAATNKEYHAVLDDVSRLDLGSNDDRGDAYQRLLNKEERVLRTVDRIVNKTRENIVEEQALLHMSLTDIAIRCLRTLQIVIDELLHMRSPYDIVRILWDGDRKIFLGILLVLLSFLIFFVSASS
jgi:hypothetical protein